jgi:hypothetical protein
MQVKPDVAETIKMIQNDANLRINLPLGENNAEHHFGGKFPLNSLEFDLYHEEFESKRKCLKKASERQEIDS